jgi:hypothetical protein
MCPTLSSSVGHLIACDTVQSIRRIAYLAGRWSSSRVVDLDNPNELQFEVLRELIKVPAVHMVTLRERDKADRLSASRRISSFASALHVMTQPRGRSVTPIGTVRMDRCSTMPADALICMRNTYSYLANVGWRGLIFCAEHCDSSEYQDVVVHYDAGIPTLFNCIGDLDIMSSVHTDRHMKHLAIAVGRSTELCAFTFRLGTVCLSYSTRTPVDALPLLREMCRAIGKSRVTILRIVPSQDPDGSLITEMPTILDYVAHSMPNLRSLHLPWSVWQALSHAASMSHDFEKSFARMLMARPDVSLVGRHTPYAIRNTTLRRLVYFTECCNPAITLAMADTVYDDDTSHDPPADCAIARSFFRSALCDRRLLHIVADLVEPLDGDSVVVPGLFDEADVDIFVERRTWYRRHMVDRVDVDIRPHVPDAFSHFQMRDAWKTQICEPDPPRLYNIMDVTDEDARETDDDVALPRTRRRSSSTRPSVSTQNNPTKKTKL